ncbi:MAG: trehalose-phosphatase [Chloroflexota bacterium]|nr:trehalose-phosphatase [Chloroflexota bacterium]
MTLDAALTQRLRELAGGPAPLLVASDLDGTLAPIVQRPEDARVSPATLTALERLGMVAHVAIVTGRDLATARALAPVPGVEFVASHGHEASFAASTLPDAAADLSERLGGLAGVLEARFAGTPLRVERKARSVAFHYRADPSLAAPLREALRELPEGLRLQPGRLVLEVLPAGGGKDTALAALVERFRPGSILVLGDDLTDVAMFEAARASGGRALVLAIGGGSETPAEVVGAADAVVDQGQVDEVLALVLDALADSPPA